MLPRRSGSVPKDARAIFTSLINYKTCMRMRNFEDFDCNFDSLSIVSCISIIECIVSYRIASRLFVNIIINSCNSFISLVLTSLDNHSSFDSSNRSLISYVTIWSS